MFKRNFERICFEKGLAPSAVCEAIGLSRSAYSGWNDLSVPRKGTLDKLSVYLQVPLSSLLEESSPSEQTSSNAMATAIYKETLSLTAEETTIIKAFRSNPSFAQIVRSTMDALGINHEEKDVVS